MRLRLTLALLLVSSAGLAQLTSPVGIGTSTPASPLEVATGGITIDLTGTHYVDRYYIGFSNDYGSGGAQQYLLLFPAYKGTVGQNSAGLSGRLRMYRGNASSFNLDVEYDVIGQTAYSSSTIGLIPRTIYAKMLNIYTVTYGGVPYLAIYCSDLSASGTLYTFEGHFWNNLNTQKPQLVPATSCTNVTLTQTGEFVAGGIYSTNTGQIGINTADPKGYTLAVNGSAIFTQATVKNYANWPDYVFGPDYRPMDLDSLQKYLVQNRHLPDMPAEEDVAQKGMDLGEMNKLLLKKIEELTLYMEDAHRQLAAQQREIEDLKRQIQKHP
jgi:hypothetical protein